MATRLSLYQVMMHPALFFLVTILCLPNCVSSVGNRAKYHAPMEEEGRISGHVQNWATLIQNYILQVNVWLNGGETKHQEFILSTEKKRF